jgi:hypothetical protein
MFIATSPLPYYILLSRVSSDGDAVAGNTGKEVLGANAPCSSKRKDPPGKPVALINGTYSSPNPKPFRQAWQ